MTDNRKCAFVAVIGAPNAGKSSLVNALVGAKISIVTRKVQTTRARVRGVLVDGDAQLVFTDTPGIFRPRRRLDRAMVAAAWEALDGADEIMLIVDAKAYHTARFAEKSDGGSLKAAEDTDAIVAALKAREAKAILVVNKIDALPRPALFKLVEALHGEGCFSDVFLISALNGDGVKDVRRHLVDHAPKGDWMYPEDQLSDISDRLLAAEITREKLFERIHEELPYQSTVETEEWTRTAKGELRVDQTIFVGRETHKPIILGKGGQTLKAIGAAARAELTDLLGEPVHLFLHVKVKENWTEDPARYRQIGLDIVD